jgi:hypothetical protein
MAPIFKDMKRGNNAAREFLRCEERGAFNATRFSFVLCLLICIALYRINPGSRYFPQPLLLCLVMCTALECHTCGAVVCFSNILCARCVAVPRGCGSAKCANLNKTSSLTFTSVYIYALLTAQELPRTLPPRSSNLVEQCICYDTTTMAISA